MRGVRDEKNTPAVQSIRQGDIASRILDQRNRARLRPGHHRGGVRGRTGSGLGAATGSMGETIVSGNDKIRRGGLDVDQPWHGGACRFGLVLPGATAVAFVAPVEKTRAATVEIVACVVLANANRALWNPRAYAATTAGGEAPVTGLSGVGTILQDGVANRLAQARAHAVADVVKQVREIGAYP